MSKDSAAGVGQFDEWLRDDSDVAALVMRQWLEPVEGKDAVIFPPTYPGPDRRRDEDWIGYVIDPLRDGSNVCLVDSVGSQANRMEPIFKREPYDGLVPRVTIRAGSSEIHLLDAGHRAADAIVRFSDLGEDLKKAFLKLQAGDAEPLARIAPTSLVFGAWDSRGTQVKVPRVVRSVIRAFDVRPMHRSAIYSPAVNYMEAGLLREPQNKEDKDRMSELGLLHAPAIWTHGGVCVFGGIRRDAALNLSALRALAGGDQGRTLQLRRYILGLALVSFTAPNETTLRQGCELVPDPARPAEWWLVRHNGTRESFELPHNEALDYARAAAASFGVGNPREGRFDPEAVTKELGQSKEARKRARRSGAGPTEVEGSG